jgi:GTP pyrophosphokinase
VKSLIKTDSKRIVDVQWPGDNGVMFVAGVRVSGDDRPAMLNDLTHAISSYKNTNIRSVNIETADGFFEGAFILSVENTEHLSSIMEKLKRVQGVKTTERFEE